MIVKSQSFVIRASDELIGDPYIDIDEVRRRMQLIESDLNHRGYSSTVTIDEHAAKQNLRCTVQVQIPESCSEADLKGALARILDRNGLILATHS